MDHPAPRRLQPEIRLSKLDIESAVGVPVNTFAYPFGEIDPDIITRTVYFGYQGDVRLPAALVRCSGTLDSYSMMKNILIVLCLLISAYSSATQGQLDSGVDGQVFIGPLCPVVRAGESCPDQPYQATLIVLNSREREVTRLETDAQGRFKIPLPPGDYLLRPQSPENMPLPYAADQSIRIEAGKYTTVTIIYDSGIR